MSSNTTRTRGEKKCTLCGTTDSQSFYPQRKNKCKACLSKEYHEQARRITTEIDALTFPTPNTQPAAAAHSNDIEQISMNTLILERLQRIERQQESTQRQPLAQTDPIIGSITISEHFEIIRENLENLHEETLQLHERTQALERFRDIEIIELNTRIKLDLESLLKDLQIHELSQRISLLEKQLAQKSTPLRTLGQVISFDDEWRETTDQLYGIIYGSAMIRKTLFYDMWKVACMVINDLETIRADQRHRFTWDNNLYTSLLNMEKRIEDEKYMLEHKQ